MKTESSTSCGWRSSRAYCAICATPARISYSFRRAQLRLAWQSWAAVNGRRRFRTKAGHGGGGAERADVFVRQAIFSEYNNTVAQVLLTMDVMEHSLRKQNAQNTFETLMEIGVIPIVNENDTVSTEEVEFGDNDTLSALVADLISADLLVILSDIDGLYDEDPKSNPEAKLIHGRRNYARDKGSARAAQGSRRGTGGMVTKAARGRNCGEGGNQYGNIKRREPV